MLQDNKFKIASTYKNYKIVFHSNDSISLLKEYAALLTETYGRETTQESLIYKHLQNPLGNSIIVYALDDMGALAAARSLWLVANNEGIAYQPCDTVTHLKHRSKGLFSHLTRLSLLQLPSDALVFNFPNDKSLPGYLKMGWSLHSENNKRFSFALPKYKRTNKCISELLPINISHSYRDYLIWRYPSSKYNFFAKKGNILISNGNSSGLLVLGGEERFYLGGFSTGYTQGLKAFLEFFLFGFSVFFTSNSRTVILDNTEDSFKKLENFVGKSDINVFMDTF